MSILETISSLLYLPPKTYVVLSGKLILNVLYKSYGSLVYMAIDFKHIISSIISKSVFQKDGASTFKIQSYFSQTKVIKPKLYPLPFDCCMLYFYKLLPLIIKVNHRQCHAAKLLYWFWILPGISLFISSANNSLMPSPPYI